MNRGKTAYEYCIENKLKVIGLENMPKIEDEFYNRIIENDEYCNNFLVSLKNLGLEIKSNSLHLKSEKYLELRMFTLVPYNIMDIQKGIQHEHSVTQYLVDHVIDAEVPDERAKRWARTHKTVIIKNGGTSNEGKYVKHIEGEIWYEGTMQQARENLKELDVKFSTFHEPDLNSMLTGISLIADERVFNKKLYPDYKKLSFDKWADQYQNMDVDMLSEMYDDEMVSNWEDYLEMIGGLNNHKLREFLFSYRLA